MGRLPKGISSARVLNCRPDESLALTMMLSRPFSDKPQRKSCSICHASFTCGPENRREKCWCDELPHVPLVASEDQGCLCPDCLKEAISKFNSAQLGFMNNPSSTKTREPSQSSLVEGDDYYYEGALIVFTARYHLRRGYCCQSRCRHCPYQDQAQRK
jgi:hypothetical protein